MDWIEANEVKWLPADTDMLLDVPALQEHYAAKGARRCHFKCITAAAGLGWGAVLLTACSSRAHALPVV
jgi:hypothetical protein